MTMGLLFRTMRSGAAFYMGVGAFFLVTQLLSVLSLLSAGTANPPSTWSEYWLFAQGSLWLAVMLAGTRLTVDLAHEARWTAIPRAANAIYEIPGFRWEQIRLRPIFLLFFFCFTNVIALFQRSPAPIWRILGETSLELWFISVVLALSTWLAISATWNPRTEQICQTLVLVALIVVLVEALGLDPLRINVARHF